MATVIIMIHDRLDGSVEVKAVWDPILTAITEDTEAQALAKHLLSCIPNVEENETGQESLIETIN